MDPVHTKLKELISMHQGGFLSREEFEHQKAQLLSGADSAGGRPAGGAPLRAGHPSAVGAYTVLGFIGEGGMGAVYRGRHRSASIAAKQGGDVAIKLLHDQLARSERFQERFEREASVLLELDHPAIVSVYDLIVDGGRLALVMEFVQGCTFDELIRNAPEPMRWEQAWPLLQQLLDGLEHAHANGVVHRDIKPENLLFTDGGQIKLLDFGIAKDEGPDSTKTGTGMGTVYYMAPEQYLDAKNVDQRADIYAFGMTAYELLAGRLPWSYEESEFQILKRKEEGRIRPPSAFNSSLPPGVVEVLRRALAVDPNQRVPTASALAGLFRLADQGLPLPPPLSGAAGARPVSTQSLPPTGAGKPTHPATDPPVALATGAASTRPPAAQQPAPVPPLTYSRPPQSHSRPPQSHSRPPQSHSRPPQSHSRPPQIQSQPPQAPPSQVPVHQSQRYQQMVRRHDVQWTASGGTAFGFFLLQGFLSMVTFGLYLLLLARYVFRSWKLKNTHIDGSPLHYRSSPIDSLGHGFVNFFLLVFSLGFATPWVIARNVAYNTSHTHLADGRRLRFNGAGVEVLGLVIMTFFLVPITLGLAGPFVRTQWAAWVWNHTQLSVDSVDSRLRGSQAVRAIGQARWRKMRFHGTAGTLFGIALLNFFLSVITFGIYGSWAFVKLQQWECEAIQILD